MRSHGGVVLLLSASLVGAISCSDEPASSGSAPDGVPVSLWDVVQIPDAREGVLAPWLAPAADGLLMTWLEPTETGHRLRFSHYAGLLWSEPVTIAEGSGFFANWADVPS